MKKITILLAAAFVSLNGVAQISSKMPDFGVKAKYSELFSQKKMMNLPVAIDKKAYQANKALLGELKAATKKAAAENYTEITSLYDAYMFLPYAGVSATVPLYVGSLVEDGNDLYVAYMGGYFKGTRISGPNSISQSLSATLGEAVVVDSVSFESNQLVMEDNGEKYYVRATDITGSPEIGWTPVLSSRTTIGGYYFPDTHEFYLPEWVALYTEDDNEPVDFTIMADLDFLPMDNFMNEYEAKVTRFGTYTEIDENGQEIEHEYTLVNDTATAILSDYGLLYVRGIDDLDPTARYRLSWTFDKNNKIIGANLANNQYVNTFVLEFKDESLNILDIYTAALLGPDPDGYYDIDTKGFNFMRTSDDNADVLCLESDMMNLYGTLGYGINRDTHNPAGSIISLLNQIKIEVSSTPTAIKGVKDNVGEVYSKEYFDISGRKVGADAKGLVIEKTRYANGKTVSRKVLK